MTHLLATGNPSFSNPAPAGSRSALCVSRFIRRRSSKLIYELFIVARMAKSHVQPNLKFIRLRAHMRSQSLTSGCSPCSLLQRPFGSPATVCAQPSVPATLIVCQRAHLYDISTTGLNSTPYIASSSHCVFARPGMPDEGCVFRPCLKSTHLSDMFSFRILGQSLLNLLTLSFFRLVSYWTHLENIFFALE